MIVPTVLDQLQEGDETFTITATSVNTYNTSYSLLATIIDNYNANAQNDSFTPVAEVGGTFNVFANDTYHGLPLNASDVTVTLAANSIGKRTAKNADISRDTLPSFHSTRLSKHFNCIQNAPRSCLCLSISTKHIR